MTSAKEIVIEDADRVDLEGLLSLLKSVDLPTEGFADHLETGIVARANGAVVGSAALEVYGSSALLRSVAVAPSVQGQGLGRRLVEASLGLARDKGVTRVYLLTETAEGYFPRFGFHEIDREKIDKAVQQSVEFTSVCSESARAMVLNLA